MTDSFTANAANYLTLKVYAKQKINGNITYTDLGIKQCSSADLDKFYEPGNSSMSAMKYIRLYKHVYCLDKWAQNTITDNLFGNSATRHDDFREIVFDVLACQPNQLFGTCMKPNATNSAIAASQMEVVMIYDT